MTFILIHLDVQDRQQSSQLHQPDQRRPGVAAQGECWPYCQSQRRHLLWQEEEGNGPDTELHRNKYVREYRNRVATRNSYSLRLVFQYPFLHHLLSLEIFWFIRGNDFEQNIFLEKWHTLQWGNECHIWLFSKILIKHRLLYIIHHLSSLGKFSFSGRMSLKKYTYIQ